MKNLKGAIPLRERIALGDEWDSYVYEVVPKGAGPEQRVETKRAFYAGAAAMFRLLNNGFDSDEEPTDLDLKYMASLIAELEHFLRDVKEGKA